MVVEGIRASVRLRVGRDRALRLGHPWILSGSVERVEGELASGDRVRVVSAEGEILGCGDWDPHSQIRVRMHAFGPEPPPPDEEWLRERIRAALGWRARNPRLGGTDALRLIHAEADRLPALTADRYGDWLVVRLTSPGMARRCDLLAAILARETGALGIWLRGNPGREEPDPQVGSRLLHGSVPDEPIAIEERGRRYLVDLRRGQKTGFYLDQRDARDLFQALAAGRRVLDLFSYTGAFATAALRGGARDVVAVESSKPAIELLACNAPEANALHADANEYLRREPSRFDLIVVDPPPFARRKADAPKAARAYKDLALRVLRRAAPGADVLTFSCSHHLPAELFRKVAFSAVAESGAVVQVLGTLGAPPDHPVDLRHPEGEYLKGLWLRVERPAG